MRILRNIARCGARASVILWSFAVAVSGGHGFHPRYQDVDFATFGFGIICHSGSATPGSERAPQRDNRGDCCVDGCCFTGCAGPFLPARTTEFVVDRTWRRPAPGPAALADVASLRDFLSERTQQPRAPPA
jgi:hypothetical protein